MYFVNTKNYKMDTEALINEQIMQIEAIELHRLSRIIEKKVRKYYIYLLIKLYVTFLIIYCHLNWMVII